MVNRRHIDEVERRKWQNPEAILAGIGLKAGLTFMDIGCGSGFFALPAARIVGESGKVYGVDKDGESISNLKKLAGREGLNNLDLTIGKAEDVIKCEACADIIFFGIVLHDFENPVRVLENARKMLKLDGRLVNLDWKKYVEIDQRYLRPTEVNVLQADTRKAQKLIGWNPKVKFKELVKIMVDRDLAECQKRSE